jgi:chromosomal replication initiation ATPase DnaA
MAGIEMFAPGVIRLNNGDVWDLDSAILSVTGFDADELRTRDRQKERAEARMIGMCFYIASGCTLKQAGLRYERDHATALHAKKTIKRYYGQKGERKLSDKIDEISRLTGIKI